MYSYEVMYRHEAEFARAQTPIDTIWKLFRESMYAPCIWICTSFVLMWAHTCFTGDRIHQIGVRL
jgi:hypothetical protein